MAFITLKCIVLFMMSGCAMGRAYPLIFNEVYKLHNQYRAAHQAQPLVWNATIAQSMQNWTNTCKYSHDPVNYYGENLAWVQIGDAPIDFNVIKTDLKWAINAWYNEAVYYNFKNPGFSYVTGHFGQTVWRASKQIGCAYTICINTNAQRYLMIGCRYFPHGNVLGPHEFENNVKPRIK